MRRKNWKCLDVLEHFHQPVHAWTPVANLAHLATHQLCNSSSSFFLGFRFLLIYATGLPVLMIPRSYFHFFLLLEFPCQSQFPAMKMLEKQVEELVDKPGTRVDVSQWISLPFLMRCGFWPLVHWSLYPNSSQSFPSGRTAGVFSRSITVTNKSNSRMYTVASCFVCTSPLAVTTVVGLLETLTVSNSAELRSVLLNVHDCSGIYHKLSFLGVYCGCGRQNPLLRRWIECSFVFLFEIEDFPGKFPRISAGTSLLSCSLFWRSVPKFSQRRDFADEECWLVFSQATDLFFSRMFAWRDAALVNRTRRVDSVSLLPFLEIVAESGGSMSRVNNSTVVRFSH